VISGAVALHVRPRRGGDGERLRGRSITGLDAAAPRGGGEGAAVGEVDQHGERVGVLLVGRQAAQQAREPRRVGLDGGMVHRGEGGRDDAGVICREVSKLRVSILDGAVLPLATTELKAARRWRKVVTPMGLEPWRWVTTRRMKTATSHDLA
jgi:hypothetical protein